MFVNIANFQFRSCNRRELYDRYLYKYFKKYIKKEYEYPVIPYIRLDQESLSKHIDALREKVKDIILKNWLFINFKDIGKKYILYMYHLDDIFYERNIATEHWYVDLYKMLNLYTYDELVVLVTPVLFQLDYAEYNKNLVVCKCITENNDIIIYNNKDVCIDNDNDDNLNDFFIEYCYYNNISIQKNRIQKLIDFEIKERNNNV